MPVALMKVHEHVIEQGANGTNWHVVLGVTNEERRTGTYNYPMKARNKMETDVFSGDCEESEDRRTTSRKNEWRTTLWKPGTKWRLTCFPVIVKNLRIGELLQERRNGELPYESQEQNGDLHVSRWLWRIWGRWLCNQTDCWGHSETYNHNVIWFIKIKRFIET